jgi:peptide/nickel transport system permease protein
VRPLVPIAGLGVGKAIVWSSSLSFLGLGVKPPSSEWGALLAAGKGQLLEAPWLLVIPGTAVVLVALSFSTVFSYIQTRSEGA